MRERLPWLSVRPVEHRESGSKRGRKLWVVARQTVIQVLDGRAVGQLEPQHWRRREPRDPAAKTNPNFHDQGSVARADARATEILRPPWGPVKAWRALVGAFVARDNGPSLYN
jgi:hypothetical protein